jgi:hypothetical protein
MTKLIVAFRNFANAPKSGNQQSHMLDTRYVTNTSMKMLHFISTKYTETNQEKHRSFKKTTNTTVAWGCWKIEKQNTDVQVKIKTP